MMPPEKVIFAHDRCIEKEKGKAVDYLNDLLEKKEKYIAELEAEIDKLNNY
jgi:hypothetical protein